MSDKKKIDLVLMVRDGKTADVHPDEVENYRRGGWEATEIQPPVEKTTAEKVQEVNDEIARILEAEKEKFGNGAAKKAKK